MKLTPNRGTATFELAGNTKHYSKRLASFGASCPLDLGLPGAQEQAGYCIEWDQRNLLCLESKIVNKLTSYKVAVSHAIFQHDFDGHEAAATFVEDVYPLGLYGAGPVFSSFCLLLYVFISPLGLSNPNPLKRNLPSVALLAAPATKRFFCLSGHSLTCPSLLGMARSRRSGPWPCHLACRMTIDFVASVFGASCGLT